MNKTLILGLVLSALANPVMAKSISKIVWLTTTEVSQSEIQNAKQAAGGSSFNIFKIDESEKIRSHFESLFPQELLQRTDNEKNAYLEKHIIPKLKAYTPEMMRAEVGVTLAKMYRIERIPAVVINDKYVTYGLSVGESINAFNNQGN